MQSEIQQFEMTLQIILLHHYLTLQNYSLEAGEFALQWPTAQ
jgi:hypothetical protein